MTKYTITFKQTITELCELAIEGNSIEEVTNRFDTGTWCHDGYEVLDTLGITDCDIVNVKEDSI